MSTFIDIEDEVNTTFPCYAFHYTLYIFILIF